MLILTNVYINIIIDFGVKLSIPFFSSMSEEQFSLLWELFRCLYMGILPTMGVEIITILKLTSPYAKRTCKHACTPN